MNIRFSLLVFILCIVMINPANGFKILKSGENVNAETIIDDDVYIFSDDVKIQGKVEGDVFAVGKSVEISGNITGDVMVLAKTVMINGTIDDDIRLGADTVSINGTIGGDMLVVASNTIVYDNAEIGDDLIFISGQMRLNGDIGRNLSGFSDITTLAGRVNGDINIYADSFEILPSTYINGSLKYSSPQETLIPPNIVKKDIIFVKKEKNERIEEILSIFWWLMNYGFLLMIGLIVLELVPNLTDSIAMAVIKYPKDNLIMGLFVISAGFLFPLLLSVILIGIPIGLILLVFTIILLYSTRIFFGFWLGKVLFSHLKIKSMPRMEMILGLLILCIFTSLSWIGFWIYLIVTIFSIGGLYKVFMSLYKEMRKNNLL